MTIRNDSKWKKCHVIQNNSPQLFLHLPNNNLGVKLNEKCR